MRPLVLVLLAVVVVAIGLYFAFSPENSGRLGFWLLAGGPSVALGALASAWAAREGLLREWLQPRWGDFTRGLAGAAVLYGAAWLFVRIVCPIGSHREIWLVSLYAQLGDPRTLQSHGPMVAVVVVAAALGEELLWRGAVTRMLAQRVGSHTAHFWAAGAYALAHLPTVIALRGSAGLNPVLVVAALGGGLLWGTMARVFGGLAPAIVAHALFDWAAIMMFPFWGGGWSR